jgi:hypothetical protein
MNCKAWWSSDNSVWLQIQKFQVQFPALPDFLTNTGLLGIIWELLWKKSSCSGLEDEINGCGERFLWPHYTLLPEKFGSNVAGPSVGIVRLRTKSHGVCFSSVSFIGYFSSYSRESGQKATVLSYGCVCCWRMRTNKPQEMLCIPAKSDACKSTPGPRATHTRLSHTKAESESSTL